MKDKTGGVAIEEFVRLKPKMCSFLVDNNKNKNAKGVNKNVAATIRNNEYKDVFWNKKCLRHSMSRVESKNHRLGTYEINKIFLSCINNKMYIQKNGLDGLALGYYS